MQFSREQLDAILRQQIAEVGVYDGQGFLRGNVRPLVATRIIAAGEYVGIGNKRRIRYIRPLGAAGSLAELSNASRTTRSIRGDGSSRYGNGQLLGQPQSHQEHKPTPITTCLTSNSPPNAYQTTPPARQRVPEPFVRCSRLLS